MQIGVGLTSRWQRFPILSALMKLHALRFALLAVFAAWVGFGPLSFCSDRLRMDVVYVDDYLKNPVLLKTIRPTILTFSREGNSPIDSVPQGQTVHLIAIGADRHLVETRVTNGKAEGWLLVSDLEPIPESVITELEAKRADEEKIKQAIAKKEILVGMPEDAITKILGRPNSKSTVVEPAGSSEKWSYLSYKMVPVQTQTIIGGTNYVSTIYQQVITGSKIVFFQDKKVIRFEVNKEDPRRTD